MGVGDLLSPLRKLLPPPARRPLPPQQLPDTWRPHTSLCHPLLLFPISHSPEPGASFHSADLYQQATKCQVLG